MAGEVQLKLQASLDLAFLRSQLASLGSLAKGYNLPIVAKLDTKQVDAAIRKVSKEIRININDSQLEGLTKRLGSVKQQLENLKAQDSKIEVGVTGRAALSQREARKVKSDLRAAVLGSEKKLYIPTSIRPVVSRDDIRDFKNEVRNKIGAIAIDAKVNLQVEAVRRGAKTQDEIDADVARGLQAISAMGEARMQGGAANGGVTEAARRTQLRTAIEELTVAQLRQVAKQLEVGGVSKLRKGDLINKIVADASIEMVKKYLDPQAMMRPNRTGLQQVLDTFARGVFHMLGLDPASMRRQAAERRALPPIDWPAQVPQRQVDIGPSSTGRALPQGAIPGMLPGTSYVSQKRLVGDILSPSLKDALRGAANAFVDNVRRELNSAVRQVSVKDLGNAVRTAIAPSRVAGLLPPSVGREPRQYAMGGETREQMFARRTTEAYIRSAARGMDVIGEGGTLPPGGGGRPPRGGGGDFRNQMGFGPAPRPVDMRIFQQARVPLAGAMRELASEFAEATKQVLLFGTAYKGLAFFLNLPRQAFDAAKALATYENQLRSVTSATGTFEQSSAFVENLAARFNVPLESARQGFVRLFASMQPAGFGQGQIENLFTGIASATATFGLSADQVERVINAFSQMASKGQIMAEELKGQLGDVLPGSLALFAEAAQMSIPEFTKAMEDGAFKGKAMQQVLDNVAVLMNQKFGPAAQNASKTLQGALNQIQNNLQLMYESLTPIVNELASAFGPAINSLLKDTASAVNALTGSFVDSEGAIGALTPRAEALYLFFKDFGPSVIAAASSLRSFAGSLQVFIGPLSIAGKGFLDFISLPVVSRVALYATVLGALNGAFALLARTGIASAIAAFVRFAITLNVAQLNVYIAGLRTLVAVLVSMATTANAARVAIAGLKIALVSLGAGAVLLAIDAIAQSLLGVGNSARQSQNDVANLKNELDNLAEAGLAEEVGAKYLEANTKLAAARSQNAAALADLRRARETGREVAIRNAEQRAEITGRQVTAAVQEVETTRRARDAAVKRRGQMQQTAAASLQPVNLSAAEDGEKKKKAELADASRLNQLLQDNLRLNTELGLIGKDDLSQLEAKVELAKQITRLEIEDIKNTMEGKNQTIALQNATLAYQLEIAKANEEWNKAIKEIRGIEQQARDLARTINGQLAEGESPLEQALIRIDEEGQRALDTIEKLFDELKQRGGLRSETGRARSLLGEVQAQIQGRTPEEKLAAASRELTRGSFADLNRQIEELQGPSLTINEIIRKIGADWNKLTPAIKDDLTALAAQVDLLTDKVKKQREALQFIQGEVGRAVDEYKSFFKEVATGGSLEEALKKFQDAITDQALTIFLDFAFKPIEQFLTDAFAGMFGIPNEETQRQEMLSKLEQQLAEQRRITAATEQTAVNTGQGATGATVGALSAGVSQGGVPFSLGGRGAEIVNAPMSIDIAAFEGASDAIQGLNESIYGMQFSLPSLGDSLKGISDTVYQTSEETKKEGATFGESLGKATSAIGIAAGTIMGIAAGISQIKEGSTSGILGGIGSILLSVGGAIGGFGKLFGGFGGGGGAAANASSWGGSGFNPAAFNPGLKLFANGGLVTGPTLGLVGEGKYNEAIVPLPDGRSIPVKMQGSSSRELLAPSRSSSMASPMLSMSFQTTTINGVEYVDRAQLEQAMAETRKLAARDGASRGASLALDKLQNSPSTRRRVGIR